MKDVIYLLFDLLATLAKPLQPGGGRTVIAENLLLNMEGRRIRQVRRNDMGFWSTLDRSLPSTLTADSQR